MIDLPQAHAYWHRLPCHHHITSQLSYKHPSWAAWATVGSGCTVYFNARTRRLWSAAELCQIVIHEIGHLLGHHHSRDPHNVMYPVATVYNRPRVCR